MQSKLVLKEWEELFSSSVFNLIQLKVLFQEINSKQINP